MRRTVTITLDEETARWARGEAARQDVSVSTLIARLVRDRMVTSERYEESMERFLSRPAHQINREGTRYPSRDRVHERPDLR